MQITEQDPIRLTPRNLSFALLIVATLAVWMPIATTTPRPGALPRVIEGAHIPLCVVAVTLTGVFTARALRRDEEASLLASNQQLAQRVAQRTRQLGKAERGLRHVIETLPDPAFLIDRDGRIQRSNRQAVLVLGYARSRLRQMNLEQLDPHWRAILAALDGSPTQPSAPIPSSLRRRDGSTLPVEFTARYLDVDGEHRILATSRDISRRAEIERRLQDSEKMSQLGMIAGGVAHDFNNVLLGIMGHAELARMRLPDGCDADANIDAVLHNVERARQLLRGIFANLRDVQPALTDLAGVAREVLTLLQPIVPAGVDARLVADDALPCVLADRTHLHRLLMNLTTNSLHALRENGGSLRIEITPRELPDPASAGLDLRAGAYLELAVHDTGHGMDAATLQRIFDPFFTTKREGEGTGLGLPVVQHLVSSMAGSLTIASTPGQGTVVRILLPARTH